MTTSGLCIWEGFLEGAGFELFEKNLIGSYWRKDAFFFLKPNSWDPHIPRIARAGVPAEFGVSFSWWRGVWRILNRGVTWSDNTLVVWRAY